MSRAQMALSKATGFSGGFKNIPKRWLYPRAAIVEEKKVSGTFF
jgi:hypothetical protein